MNDKAIVLLLNRDQIHTLLTNHEDFSKEAVKMAARRKVQWQNQDYLEAQAAIKRMLIEWEFEKERQEWLRGWNDQSRMTG